jgi:integrase
VVAALWALAGTLGGDSEKFLKLLILTGKRRNTVQGMRWENIAADWYWKPSGGSDIKRATPIPLPAFAQRVLGKRQNAGKVMQVSGETAQQLIRTVRTKLKLPDPVRERLGLPVPGLGLPDYLHHGLRHIFETRTGELGVKPHTRDLLLDHAIARSASGRGYDHGVYKAELLEALTLWADHIERLVAPGEGVRMLR